MDLPKVTCIMPTYNRPAFARMALRCFLAQDYPTKELILIDDGTYTIENETAGLDEVVFVAVDHRMTIGAKRNLACDRATGDVILHWDDDDWNGPRRIRTQVEVMQAAGAEVSAVAVGYLYDLVTDSFFTVTAADTLRQPFVSYATLGYLRETWRSCGGFPDQSLGEDVELFHRAVLAGARSCVVSEPGLFVVVRHGANSWRFEPRQAATSNWTDSPPPPFFPPEAIDYYRSISAPHAHRTARNSSRSMNLRFSNP